MKRRIRENKRVGKFRQNHSSLSSMKRPLRIDAAVVSSSSSSSSLSDLCNPSISFISPPQSPTPPHHHHRHYDTCHQPPAHNSAIIAQSSDSEMDTSTVDDDDDCYYCPNDETHKQDYYRNFRPSNKKIRTTGDYSTTSTVNHPLTAVMMRSIPEDQSQKQSPPNTTTTVKWWKQKSRSTMTAGQLYRSHPIDNRQPREINELPSSSSSCSKKCYVCQSQGEKTSSFFSSVSSNETSKSNCDGGDEGKRKQKNSLLSYFRTTTTRSPPSVLHPSVVKERFSPTTSMTLETCHYCDRLSCSTCRRTCERCAKGYCTFCSTINYDRPVERMFCLDCEQSLDVGGGGDEDVMMDIH